MLENIKHKTFRNLPAKDFGQYPFLTVSISNYLLNARYYIMALNLVGWNVVLDSDDADKLSAFYEKLLGWTRFPGEEFTVLANITQGGFPTWITFQQVDDYVPPVWPATLDKQQQMAHLDFHVENVEEAVKHALSCGATMSEIQCEDGWRVMIDPAGHPFCLLPPPPWVNQGFNREGF